MKNILIIICLIFCFSSNGFCEKQMVEPESETPLTLLLTKLENQGYKVIVGPVQYLGKSKNQVLFYRQKPVNYRTLRTIDVNENFKIIKKYDFVYVLLNQGNLVLIYSEREKRNDT